METKWLSFPPLNLSWRALFTDRGRNEIGQLLFNQEGDFLIKSFSLHNVLLILKLQRKGVPLDPERALTQPVSPLRAALATKFSFCFPHSADICTYVLCGSKRGPQLSGFAQIEQRRERPEANVIYLAPSLSETNNAQTTLYHLLRYLCIQASERGTQRLFASIAEGSQEIEVFRQVGFSVYTREDIFRLETSAVKDSKRGPDAPDHVSGVVVRRRHSRDNWALQRLYAAITPRLVQQAEGLTPREWGPGPNHWFDWTRKEEYVLENSQGESRGYLQISEGSIGHWLKLALHPHLYRAGKELLDYGLSLLLTYPPLPIHCSVREYEGGMSALLEAQGFKAFERRAIMVKHTSVRVREPDLKLAPILEKRAEVTPTSCGGGIVGSSR
jgi:hypothetical protein